ncbi:MAG: energy-coupling factor transporter transmembrane protein EcfT, partial [Atopostipes sp.]|nr:energy-coupling factor transporter transmembrane protein EcfT [Atopostipes sp.]
TISTLLTLTTEALEIADAIEFYLSPLKYLNFPVAETTMMLSISLRFVPTMVDEAEVIMNAQKARGVSFNEGNIIDRIKSFIPLLIPLFVNSYDRAPELATAMEARAYQGGEGRTKYRELTWHSRDTGAVFVMFLFFILISLINF